MPPPPSAQPPIRRRRPVEAGACDPQVSRRRRRLPVDTTASASSSSSSTRGRRLLGLLATLAALSSLAGVGALVVEHPCCANHLHVPAAFGPDLLSQGGGPLEGKTLAVVEPEDACCELKASVDLRGKVALVRRGECNFTEKCLRAQAKGAVAVVVYDSQERERWGTIMSGVEERASLVTIPAVFVSHATGVALREAALGNQVASVRVTLNDTGHVKPRAKQIGPVETLATYVVVSLVLLSFSGCCGLLLALAVTCYQRAFRQRAMRGLKLQVYTSKRGGSHRGGQHKQPVKGAVPSTTTTTTSSSSSTGVAEPPPPPSAAAPAAPSSILTTALGALADVGSRLWPPRLLSPLFLRRGRRRRAAGIRSVKHGSKGGGKAAPSGASASEGEGESEVEEEEEEALCPICLDHYEDGDRLRVLPCGHHYHDACIRPWLMEKSENCPKCRQPAFHPPLSSGGNRTPGGGATAAAAAAVPPAGGGGTVLRGLVTGVLNAVAGNSGGGGVEEGERARGNGGDAAAGGPLDAAAVDELCIWLLSNLSGIAMVLVAVITSAFLLGAVAILTPKD